VLDEENHLVHGFDNSPDVVVTKLRYEADWKEHLNEEISHAHDATHHLRLISEMTFDAFMDWLDKSISR
jgi:hypothetical protein